MPFLSRLVEASKWSYKELERMYCCSWGMWQWWRHELLWWSLPPSDRIISGPAAKVEQSFLFWTSIYQYLSITESKDSLNLGFSPSSATIERQCQSCRTAQWAFFCLTVIQPQPVSTHPGCLSHVFPAQNTHMERQLTLFIYLHLFIRWMCLPSRLD